MVKKCEICEFLDNPRHQVLITEHWNAGIGNNHAYLGRAYVSLRKHKSSLGALNEEGWQDFHRLVRKLEIAYKQAFGAEPLNWGCYMNLAFQTEPFNPHVHWHIYPRYKIAPVIDGITFDDPQYGNFYNNEAKRLVDDEVVTKIAQKLRENV